MRTYFEGIDQLLKSLGTARWLPQEYERLIGAASAVRQYENVIRPQLQIKEQIDRLTSGSLLQKTVDQYVNQSALGNIERYKDLVASESIAAAMRKLSFIDQLQSSQVADVTGAYGEMLQSMANRLAELNRPFGGSDAIRRLQELLDDSLLSNISVDENGTITVNGYEIDSEVAADDLETVGDIAKKGASALDAIVNALQALGPYARAVVLYVLLPYLISIIANINTPMHEEWLKSVRGESNRQATKDIKAHAAMTYSPNDLRQFRFVKCSALHVRLTGSIQSPKLDQLYLGKTIRLLKRERDWSFVEYVDTDTPEPRQGWVLSRYLARFDQ
ncbi:MAG: hypothetical protein Q7K57_07325 [Burkholderiaceae bacterium]|nr:hypothetical protein [Burkholderiaceae bacterium]